MYAKVSGFCNEQRRNITCHYVCVKNKVLLPFIIILGKDKCNRLTLDHPPTSTKFAYNEVYCKIPPNLQLSGTFPLSISLALGDSEA